MTETNAMGASFSGPRYLQHPRATGLLSAAIVAKISPDGELLVRGGAVIRQYWPDKIARNADGWLPTGDLAEITNGNLLTIVGRSKEMILRGGENIR